METDYLPRLVKTVTLDPATCFSPTKDAVKPSGYQGTRICVDRWLIMHGNYMCPNLLGTKLTPKCILINPVCPESKRVQKVISCKVGSKNIELSTEVAVFVATITNKHYGCFFNL